MGHQHNYCQHNYCRCANPTLTRDCLRCGRVRLTPRESDVVELLQRGLMNREISARLKVTEGAIKMYLQRIFNKLNCRNRTEVVVLSLKK